MEAANRKCWLLEECPAEIRLMVWKEIFTSRTGKITFRPIVDNTPRGYVVEDEAVLWHDFRMGYSDNRFCLGDDESLMSMSLSMTCKQIYAETSALLWMLNRLVFD
jgi:hypothetical protein